MSPTPSPAAAHTDAAAADAETQAENDSDETETDTEDIATAAKATAAKATAKKPKVARTYIPIQKQVLQAMDEHIIMVVLNADTNADKENGADVKPSTCYAEFCSKFSELVADEMTRLIRVHSDHPTATATAATATAATATAVADKLKATYKNRMFIIKRAH
jgi:hypothetical protein